MVGIRTDSPTIRKGNIKVFLTVAAKQNWKIETSDVSCAFLQTVNLDRDVYVLPPRERRKPGFILKLCRPVYGLVDASRGFYLNLKSRFA